MNAGISPNHLLDRIIRPALYSLYTYSTDLHSDGVERLLLGTAAHASHLGHWIVTTGGDESERLGLYGMTGRDENAVWAFLQTRTPHIQQIYSHVREYKPRDLQSNLKYATVMARLYYWLANDPVPGPDDEHALAQYWEQYWCHQYVPDRRKWLSDYRALVLSRMMVVPAEIQE